MLFKVPLHAEDSDYHLSTHTDSDGVFPRPPEKNRMVAKKPGGKGKGHRIKPLIVEMGPGPELARARWLRERPGLADAKIIAVDVKKPKKAIPRGVKFIRGKAVKVLDTLPKASVSRIYADNYFSNEAGVIGDRGVAIKPKTLNAIKRALKDGGEFRVTTPAFHGRLLAKTLAESGFVITKRRPVRKGDFMSPMVREDYEELSRGEHRKAGKGIWPYRLVAVRIRNKG